MKRLFSGTLFFTLLALLSAAQPGTLDPSFNPVGVAGPNNSVEASVELPNGKILIGGYFTKYREANQRSLALINPDGSLDASFQTGTGVRQSFNLNYPTAVGQIARRSDGKFWVGGLFDRYNDSVVKEGFMRLLPDGRLDTSFHPPLPNVTYMRLLKLYADDKALVYLTTRQGSNPEVKRILRLKANDQIDSSYTFTIPAYSLNTTGSEYFVLPDDKLLVYGNFSTVNGVARKGLARLMPDGSLDATFVPNVAMEGTYVLRGFGFQPDGKILVGGKIATVDGVASKQIARLNTDGSRDAGFNPPQIGDDQFSYVWEILVQPDGKIVVGGDWANIGAQQWEGLVRLNANGTLDAGFSVGHEGFIWQVDHLNLLSNGKLLVGGGNFGYHDYAHQYVALVGTDGAPDPAFNWENGANDFVHAVSLQPDGAAVIGGTFSRVCGTPAGSIARMKPDGNLDYYFGLEIGTGFNAPVKATAVQADGKILAGGLFTSFNGTAANGLARLKATGERDNSFNMTAGFNGEVLAIALQPDGKILVGGRFTSAIGQPRNYLARLLADGTFDAGFNANLTLFGSGGNVRAIVVQPDGKIIVGGNVDNAGGPAAYVARLNADGSRDAGFATTGTGFNGEVLSLALQADGKLVAGGVFSQYNSISTGHLVRLTATGGLDAGFITANGAADLVNAVLVQPDGKVLASGIMGAVSGQDRGRVVRFNENGTLDNFSTANGPDGPVLAMALQPSGHILVGGAFGTVGGTARNRIARINGTDVAAALPQLTPDASLEVFPNPSRGLLQVRTGARGVQQLRLLAPDGTVLSASTFSLHATVDLRRFPAASYFLEVVDARAGKRTVRQLVKL